MSDTRAFLLFHVSAYPKAELSDLFKALYQSAFGCEHLVADASAAEAYIASEAAHARAPAAVRASSRWTGRMSASIWIF